MRAQDSDWTEKTLGALIASREAINAQVRDVDERSKLVAACMLVAEAAEHMHGDPRFQAAREVTGSALVELMAAAVSAGPK